MTGAKTCHQHQMYRYHRSSDEIWTMRLHEYLGKKAIQQSTASVRQRIATGVIAEPISLQTGHDGQRSGGMMKGELPDSTFQEMNKNEVKTR